MANLGILMKSGMLSLSATGLLKTCITFIRQFLEMMYSMNFDRGFGAAFWLQKVAKNILDL